VLNFANLSLVLLWLPFPRASSGVLYIIVIFGSRRTRHSLIKSPRQSRGFTLSNYLKGGEQEAQNIIDSLMEFNSELRVNIIGAIFTSRDVVYDKFNDKIFIETVKKGEPGALIKSLIKSSYSYFVSMYKNEMLSAIDKSFLKLLSRKDIIPYLSKMAFSEGISNYQILTEWFKLLNNYQLARSPFLPDLLRLSNIMSLVNNEDAVTDSIDDDLLELNSFELFDCFIDNYYLPTMPGDVFCNSNDNIYILVGQECDYMMAEKRKRNNLICELVKAEIINIESIKK
jgi:hypothetical protein